MTAAAARCAELPSADPRPLPLECHSCPVRKAALCGAVDAASGEALAALGRRQRLAVVEGVAWQDEPSPVVGVVRGGIVQLTARRSGEGEQIVGVARAGEFIGRPFGGPMPYAISAATDAEVCLFPRDGFDRLAIEHPDLGHALLTVTLDELERTRRWLGMLGKKTSGQKVAAFVAEIAGLRWQADRASPRATVAELPFTRLQIADVLGLTFETVSRQFTMLRASGAIRPRPNRRLEIVDPELLLTLSGESADSWH